MALKQLRRFGLLASGAALVTTPASGWNWAKVDPILCQQVGDPDSLTSCPTEDECEIGSFPESYRRFPELTVWTGDHYFYCPVPDETDVPVWNINAYRIDGYSAAGSYSAARGCIQFTNGYGESCYFFAVLPAGAFQGWSLPPPTQWQEWWHMAYVEFRLNGGASSTRIYKIFVTTP